MTTLAVTSVDSLFCQASTCFRIGSKRSRIHITGERHSNVRGQLFANLDRYELWGTSGIPERAYDIFGGQSSHDQCQIAFGGCLYGASIDPLHVFRGASAANQLHQKFCVHDSLLRSLDSLLWRSRCTG